MTDAAPRPADALRDPAAAEAALTERLAALGAAVVRHAHPPLHTVAESRALRGQLPGGHCKNLFLKEKKGGFWLVTCREDRRVRIPDIARAAGLRRFSFGSAEDLAARLGVRPGAVTPLAVVNDTEQAVGLILDAQMMAGETLNCHPLHNEATVRLSTADLRRLFAATGHAPIELDFDALEALAAATPRD